jgi:predicted TIM-barrel fold metal-dependent hydrolase
MRCVESYLLTTRLLLMFTKSMDLVIDLHQHIWTEPLLDALGRRSSLPFVQRSDGLTVLHSAGERAWIIDVEAETAERRRELNAADGIDLALIAISSPIGVEALPRPSAQALIDAHLDGVEALGEGFAAWGAIPLEDASPRDVESVLERGCIGISLPAQALAGEDVRRRLGPVLAQIAAHEVPLFIHPGSAPGHCTREASLTEPLWWRALTDYVAQMQAAWLTFVTVLRRDFPTLKALFAMLAGCAPLLSERLAARGGPPIDLRDPLIFYDTSSFGPDAIGAVARSVGPPQLVYGSDRPLAEASGTGALQLRHNASPLLARSIRSVAA